MADNTKAGVVCKIVTLLYYIIIYARERIMTTEAEHSVSEEDLRPERITDLTIQLASKMDKAIKDIQNINLQTHVLSINANVEANRAGEAGKTFAVVATEMGTLSDKIKALVGELESETSNDFKEIARINEHISTSFRGTRLSDLALVNIDLIDRNLYERSCDVRWWATDSSIVDALTEKTPEACEFASQRMGVILDSYTVYFDLVVADLEGVIIANGRKDLYNSVGDNVSDSKWFRAAMECATGDDYGWETVHRSPLVSNELALVYTTAVRDNGEAHSKVIGALGIIFRFEALAQTIVENVPLSKEEKERSRICIVNDKGLVLADSDHRNLEDTIEFKMKAELFNNKKGFIIDQYDGAKCCIGHATASGYETYTTGWHSLIIQKL
ncbi:MAG: methyl-accepting chemotaxis protein [Candidatus Scalindua sp.]|nr:methyl-accepting chemotaxis protein [Candidatus Scalindua sp.]MDV5167136.1 methyl-accepting chemotaxis protein [Candidatus Scalindua sp.]